MKIVQDAFLRRTEELDRRLGVGRSFDMVGRSLTIGGRRARLWVVNAFPQHYERVLRQRHQP